MRVLAEGRSREVYVAESGRDGHKKEEDNAKNKTAGDAGGNWLLLFANLVFGGEVKADSAPGMSFLLIRVVLGIALLVVGLRWRKPPKHEAPEVPKALERLRNIGLVGAFISGVLLADYVGPVIASLAITTSTASLGGRLLATLVYTALATGIPAAFLIISITSDTAGQSLDGTMSWVMGHRRQLASWIALILGVLLIGDGIVGLILLGD